MGKLTDKVKDTLMGAKDTVVGTDDQDHKRDTISDTLTENESKEPMAPAKIQEHEPTAVKREMTERLQNQDKRAQVLKMRLREALKERYDERNRRCRSDQKRTRIRERWHKSAGTNHQTQRVCNMHFFMMSVTRRFIIFLRFNYEISTEER